MKAKDPFQIANVHEVFTAQQSSGQKAADAVANLVGSWRFIIVQCMLIVLWIIVNSIAFINHWDAYPFILMNLALSMQAALTAPIIMMSQNRQSEKDRIESHIDYQVNLKAEEEVRQIMDSLQEIKATLRAMQDQMDGADEK
jgi:uncharacterized membrane protein